jgi:hypothetical protein
MHAVAHIEQKSPGAMVVATGAEGLAVGLSTNVLPQFTGRAQA